MIKTKGLFMADNLTDKPTYNMTPQERKIFLKKYGLSDWLDKLIDEYNSHDLDKEKKMVLWIKILATENFINEQLDILEEEKNLKLENRKLQDRDLFIKTQAASILKKGETFIRSNEGKAVIAGHENLRRELTALEEKFKALEEAWEELYSDDIDFLIS
jgi:hypothetical protein